MRLTLPNTRRFLLICAPALLLALACGPRPERCVFADDCPEDGIDYRCNEGLCVETPCESSNDCDLGSHCGVWTEEGLDQSQIPEDVGLEKVCLEGCQRDDDCLPGFFCREGECEKKPCRNGHLDCGFCETCNSATGECEPAGEPFCRRCSEQDTQINDQKDVCDPTVTGHPICGVGNACWPYDGERTCAVRCNTNSDCPGGFVCTDYFQWAPGCAGELRSLGRFCLGDCIGSAVCRGEEL